MLANAVARSLHLRCGTAGEYLSRKKYQWPELSESTDLKEQAWLGSSPWQVQASGRHYFVKSRECYVCAGQRLKLDSDRVTVQAGQELSVSHLVASPWLAHSGIQAAKGRETLHSAGSPRKEERAQRP